MTDEDLTSRELLDRAQAARDDIGFAVMALVRVNGRIRCEDSARLSGLADAAQRWSDAIYARVTEPTPTQPEVVTGAVGA